MMVELPATTVDVRDMVCAQALAVVAKALARLPSGATATLLYDTDDVRRDLLAWAAGRGYTVAAARPPGPPVAGAGAGGSSDRRAGEVPGALQVTKQR